MISELFPRLRSLGIKLWLEGDALRYGAPAGRLSDELRAEIRDHREAIVAFLRESGSGASDGAGPISPRTRSQDVPLSFAQQRLWFLHQLEPDSPAYNMPLTLRFRGPLDVDALEATLAEIVRRHEILRTSFPVGDGTPRQIVADASAPPWSFEDLSASEPTERERLVREAVGRETRRPFDLATGPVVRFALMRITEVDHVFVMVFHHIVTDGWSMGIFHRELRELYEAYAAGRASPLPEPEIQYADFAVWQREHLSGERLDRQLAYWRKQLEGLQQLELPTDRARPPVQASRGAAHHAVLDDALSRLLVESTGSSGATVSMIVQAAFAVLLGRYTGQLDVCVGVPIANRNRAEIEALMGFFVNSLAIRTDLRGNPTFAELLERVRATSLEAYAHQDLPFERLVEDLRPERDASRNPLFQVSCAVQNAPMGSMSLPGLEIEPFGSGVAPTHFDLELHVWEAEGRHTLVFLYNPDLFDAETVSRFGSHFQTLLRAALEDPDRRIDSLPIMDPTELRRQLVEWNDTAADFATDATLHGLVQVQVARSPDAPAIRFAEHRWTYAQLAARAAQVARGLHRRGVRKGDLVGVCLERTPDMIASLLGVLEAGAAYVPLDPTHPAPRLALMLEDARPRAVVTETSLLAVLDACWPDGPDAPPRTPLVLDDPDADIIDATSSAEGAGSGAGTDVTAEDLAYVIYTSGSTGRPKGVEIRHGNVVNLLRAIARRPGLSRDDALLAVTTPSFDISVLELFGPLSVGGEVVLASAQDASLGPSLIRCIEESGATLMQATPATWRMLFDAGWSGKHDLRVLVGGEALPPDLARELSTTCGPVWNMYGPTETTVWSSCFRIPEGGGPVRIGTPLDNTTLYVLDSASRPVPLGVPGELFIGGAGVARGYRHRPELTAERFVRDAFSRKRGARLYRTGDRVRQGKGGTIEYLGRLDNQVKIRGFRIECGEIEAQLTALPGVEQAVVVARPDRRGAPSLAAYLVAGPEAASSDDLVSRSREHLRRALPDYMVPASFNVLEQLPLTPNGKVDRKALPEPGGARQIDFAATAPRTTLERTIASIWGDVLEAGEIGIHDNFFDLGGHSLLLVKLHRRLLDAFDTDLSVVELFQYPTVAALAARIGGSSASPQRFLADARARVSKRGSARGEGAIAVIGMEGRFPGAPDVDALWANLCGGVDSIQFFSDEELRAAGVPEAHLRSAAYVRAKGIIDDADLFDAGFFGYSPREAELIDPQQRIFLECAWAALERAGHDAERFDGLIGVFAGAGRNTYVQNVLSHPELAASAGMQLMLGADRDYLTTRVSYKLGLRGPSLNVQTACSTSLVAIHQAARSLLAFESDMALAGGVGVSFPTRVGYEYQEGGIVSPDGHCRTFDASARGTVGGCGAGVVVLRRLADAIEERDTIHAVIRGSAINNDGSGKVGFTAPAIDGQSSVIALALADAGIEPATIGYVEAHGTGTALGDPVEVAALSQAFGPRRNGKPRCALGSVKSNIGHLDAAAGVASFIKASLCLTKRQLVPSAHFVEVNPAIDLEGSPFYVSTEHRSWDSADDHPRRAGVSSFGLGGTNAHVVLEEPPQRSAGGAGRPWQVLTLSGRSARALDATSEGLRRHLARNPGSDLADVAYTLQVGRKAFKHRRVVQARNTADALEALAGEGARSWTSVAKPEAARVVFMFPGQGSQFPGMGRDLYASEAVFRDTVDTCARLVRPELDRDLEDILYPDEGEADADEQLTSRTLVTQSALFAVELALARLWMSWGVEPVACIGHSVGEYVAACVSGALSLEDAVELLVARGKLMDHAPAGAMLAVRLDEPALRERLSEGVWLSALNAPESCVVAGEPARIIEFEARLRAEDIECRRLRTAGAFHSGLMDGVIAPLAEAARNIAIHPVEIPYVSNITGNWVGAQDLDPEYWGRHVREAVRFDDGLRRILEGGAHVLLEVGPGNTLSTLARRSLHLHNGHDPSVLTSLRHAREEAGDHETMSRALGRLWARGISPDWRAYHASSARNRVELPTYPFERERYWIERASGPPQPGVEATGKGDPQSWFHTPIWKQAPPRRFAATEREEREGTPLVFLDPAGLGESVALALEAATGDVVRVRAAGGFARTGPGSYEIDAGSPADVGRLLDALDEAGTKPSRVVHAWSVAADASDPDAFDLGFYGLLHLLQRLPGDANDPLPVTVLTNRLHSIVDEPAWRPERSAVLALCRIAAQNDPGLRCHAVDLDWAPAAGPAPTAADVARWLDETGTEPVAYRGPRRFVRALEAMPLAPVEREQGRLRPGGVYLITGGLGRVALALARFLARTAQARLVLLSRAGLPASEAPPTDAKHATAVAVAELEALGSEVMVVRADVADADQLRAAIEHAEAHLGPLNGVIHAAGALSPDTFKPLAEISRRDCELQFTTKWRGVVALREALGDRALDFRMLTSSLSVELGGMRYAAYASANTIMDHLAERFRREDGVAWTSVDWDGWIFEGMDAAAAPFALTADEGAEAFDRILGVEDGGTVVVCTGNLQQRSLASRPKAVEDAPTLVHERPELENAYVAPRDDTEHVIAEAWRNALGIEHVGIHDNFFELGGDSLIAVQLATRLASAFQVEVGVQALFEAPTVATLAAWVEEAREAVAADADTIARLTRMVGELSDEEVARYLAEQEGDGEGQP